jgi:hypothetical protein
MSKPNVLITPDNAEENGIPPEMLWRPAPAKNDQNNPFEIGVSISGAVSAGSYEAGVFDFLIEALDQWEAEKAANPNTTPAHAVRLVTLAGASAGGMTAGIAANALGFEFQPARVNQPEMPPQLKNLLYHLWVVGIDITNLTGVRDLATDSAPLLSVLDSTHLDTLAEVGLQSGQPKSRSYLNNPLHVALSHTNLNGFAYKFPLTGGNDFGVRVHEDLARFAVVYPQMRAGLGRLPNEQPLGVANKADAAWDQYSAALLGTGAFPAGLAPRELSRDARLCDYRLVPVDDWRPDCKDNTGGAMWLDLLNKPVTGPYQDAVVDGGCLNNDPFDVARTTLAGLLGRNPRGPLDTRRAVIMISAFTDPDADSFQTLSNANILKVLIRLLFNAYKSQARSHLREWALAASEGVYSRFLIMPSGHVPGVGMIDGDRAICSTGLAGFLGFLHEEYRKHDYFLGRRNCQRFLQQHFCLPANHSLFDAWGSAPKDRFVVQGTPDSGMADNSGDMLPIIPLVGTAAEECVKPAWPAADLYLKRKADIVDGFEERIDRLLEVIESQSGFAIHALLALVATFGGKSQLKDKIIETIETELRERKLL